MDSVNVLGIATRTSKICGMAKGLVPPLCKEDHTEVQETITLIETRRIFITQDIGVVSSMDVDRTPVRQ